MEYISQLNEFASDIDWTIAGLTANRLTASDASKVLISTDLNAWVDGTTNQVTVTDDTDGSITLSLPQDIHTGANPTFASVTCSNMSSNILVATGGIPGKLTDALISEFITGTPNQISRTTGGGSYTTLSLPQDIALTSDVQFGSANLLKITEQLRLSYDVSNYASFTVDSAGDLTIAGGNVGIGTSTTPGAKFHVDDGSTNYAAGVPCAIIESDTRASLRLATTTAGSSYEFIQLVGTAYEYEIGVFNSDGNLYFNPTKEVGVTGSTMVMTAGGNVGIGTSTPDAKLEIFRDESTANADYDFQVLQLAQGGLHATRWPTYKWSVHGIGGSDSDALKLKYRSDTAGAYAELMTFDGANSNVGIGTSTPDAKLHVLGTTGQGIQIDGATTYGFQITSHTATTDYLKFRSVNRGTSTTNVDNILILDRTGNVGIGTTDPTAKLTLGEVNVAQGEAIRINGDASQNYMTFYNNTTRQGYIGTNASGGGTILNSDTTSLSLQTSGAIPIVFTTNAVDRMTIDASGNVGIGTLTAPHGSVGWAKLAIDGTASSSAGPHVQYTVSTDDYPVFSQFNYSHNNIHLMFDAYYESGSKSSDAGSNFAIVKNSDTLLFRYDSGITAGSAITWNDGLILDARGNLGINGSSFGGGVKAIFIANCTTVPTSNPTGGGILYASGGNLIWRGSSGSLTTLAVA
jgi:hypothetical protein